MPQDIQVTKVVYDKTTYPKVIDTQFSQLINITGSLSAPVFTLDDFFQLYSDLFYQIPKTGDINSHTFILNKTASYLGVQLASDVNVQALLTEITSLQQQLLQSNQLINQLSGAATGSNG